MKFLTATALLAFATASFIPENTRIVSRGLPSGDADDSPETPKDFVTSSDSMIRILRPVCYDYCKNPESPLYDHINGIEFEGKESIRSCYPRMIDNVVDNSLDSCCVYECDSYAAQ